jgi:hypothetical protein
MREGTLPSAWKVARITPLYKKGPVLEPKSYRMLAVSSVLYRVYANVVRDVMTEWCVSTGSIPAEQFGFYPGRDTTQPCFILRHLCHAAQWAKKKGERRDSRLYAAFVDFSEAYDRVDRQSLWQHLERIRVPAYLLGAVRGMYERDAYMMVDGSKRSALIRPSRGVKQGCPLSPLLFALYINDFGSLGTYSSPVRDHGVRLRGVGSTVSFMFYADDLVLVSETTLGLRRMLDALDTYSRWKGLTVNVGKTKVVVFNSRSDAEMPSFTFGQVAAPQPLDVVHEFKYLGLVFRHTGKVARMQEPWSRSLLGAWFRVRKIARQFGVHKSVPAVARLFQTFAFSSGMYGCQVWGTRYAHISRVFHADVSVRQLGIYRSMLGVSKGCYRWAVLAELGAKPYHFYWVRALMRFQKTLHTSNSPLLRDAARADALLSRDRHLADGGVEETCKGCWTAELGAALRSIGETAGLAEEGALWESKVRAGQVLVPAQVAQVTAYDVKAWQECTGRDVRAEVLPAVGDGDSSGRKMLTYFTHFKPARGRPAYLKLDMSLHKQIRQMARFRLSCHTLRVELGRRNDTAWRDRTCMRCSTQHKATLRCAVDDEQHMIFDCELFEQLRNEVVEFVPGSTSFTPGVRTILDRANGCVRAFMESDPMTVLRFISRCMDILDEIHTAGSRQAEANL